MRKITLSLIFAIILTSCDTFAVAPQPFPVQSPVPSITPGIITPTPLIISPPTFTTLEVGTNIPATTMTNTPPPTLTLAVDSSTPTFSQPGQPVSIDILGCNTSIDILNGMGEVTNAYVTIKNNTASDMPNACGLLRAIDEGREHPDKKVCINNLPAKNQVTLKLTVDSTYQQDTIIQVDVLSNDVVLLRVDKQSCRDISLFGGAPSDVGVIKPIP